MFTLGLVIILAGFALLGLDLIIIGLLVERRA